jgi:uncharacterized protein (DUF1697 family)
VVPWVVFLRAVNVGGANRCQPALIAKQLDRFDIVNIGAVGTFLVRGHVSASALGSAIAKRLPFKCEIMICPANELLNLAKENPFAGDRNDDIDAHVSIMRERLAKIPKLPIYAPSKNKWEIKILDVRRNRSAQSPAASEERPSLPECNRRETIRRRRDNAQLEHDRESRHCS